MSVLTVQIRGEKGWERKLRWKNNERHAGKQEEDEKYAEFNHARGKSVSALRWACICRPFGSLERIKAELLTYRWMNLRLTRTPAMVIDDFRPLISRTKRNGIENNSSLLLSVSAILDSFPSANFHHVADKLRLRVCELREFVPN